MSSISINRRWMSPPPVYDSRSTSQSTTTLTPYLQLSHYISLAWLAYPILSLLFVIFRLQISAASAQNSVGDAKADMIASCKAAEQAATSAASMPRYMAAATNQQITDAVNGTMDAARATMVLSLTIMEAIINFIIGLYRSTFLCFVELVVRGGLDIFIGAYQELSSFVTSTCNGIRSAIQDEVSAANSVIQAAVDGINKINPFGNISVPQFSVPSLSSLSNVTLPTDFENSLIALNNSLPSLSQVKDGIESIIDTPFELVKKDINDTFAAISFNVSALPVPEQNTVEFCSQLDTSVIDDLGHDLVKTAQIGIIVLIVIAVLLFGANCALEWYKWRMLKQHLQNTRDAWTSDPTICHVDAKGAPTVEMSDYNLLVLQADSTHPFLTRLANRLSQWLRLSPSQYTHLRFFFNYVFHPPALACFLIGFFGLLSVELQLLAMGPLVHEYSQRATASTADLSNTIATSINASMYNQSAAYATQVNTRISTIQSTVNDGLFGWVNGTTTALNNTVNAFYTDVQDIVTKLFNGTVLESPAQEFIKCLIGSKVDDIEEALTFLNQNLHINLTQVNDNVLVLSPEDVNEATQPIAAAAVGGNNSSSSGIVGSLVHDYEESLMAERVMFGVFMGLWAFVALMALCIIFWHSYGRDWLEAYRRRRFHSAKHASVRTFAARFGTRAGNEGGSGEKAPEADPELLSRTRTGFWSQLSRSKDSTDMTTAQDDGLSKHPLSTRKPDYEQAWDSYMDHAKGDSEPDRKPSVSTKLMALGRKMTRRDKSQEDEEKLEAEGPDASSEPSWVKRMTGLLWKKDDTDDHASETESMKQKTRPPLTITTSRTSDAQDTAREADDSLNDGLKSAWSVSPGPPSKLPWLNTIAPTLPARKPMLPAASHPERKPHRISSVPTDVDSVYDDSTMPIPLHYAFERPGPTPIAATPKLYQFPPAPRNVAPPPMLLSMNPDTSTQVTRLLTTTHARHSSLAMDPFVTPFDDEHRVPAPETPKDPFADRRSFSTNPFVAI